MGKVLPRYLKIRESHRGLSASSNYYFVIEGTVLRHISEYAVEKHKVGDTAEYLVDIERIRGKLVVEVLASNSGIICSAPVFKAEDLPLDALERPEKLVKFSYLNEFHFSFLKPQERAFLENEWRKYYVPMLLELRIFVSELEKSSIYVRMSRELDCQVRSEAMYPLSYLIPYSSIARRKSLGELTKFIHQAWIMLKLIEGLQNVTELFSLSNYIAFEQSSYYPVFIYELRGKTYSVWWEFDLHPESMCNGVLQSRTLPPVLHDVYGHVKLFTFTKKKKKSIRPDIVILRNTQSCDDILNRGLDAVAVFECKDQDYRFWAHKVTTQIKPYAEILRPIYMFLISMKPVPAYVQRDLEKYGITVIDNTYPGGEGEKKLIELAQYLV